MTTYITSEDCMGRTQVYWRAEHTCSDGKLLLASGDTEQQAKDGVACLAEAHERFLKQSPIERLRKLASGDLLDSDQRDAIRLISQILCAWKDIDGK